MPSTTSRVNPDSETLRLRLGAQALSTPMRGAVAETVAHFGALQAQDPAGVLWAVGLRTEGATEASVEAALDAGEVLRTHVFRFTWQLVAATDLRWMLALVGPRLLASAASWYARAGLDARKLKRVHAILREVLIEAPATRNELAQALEDGGITTKGKLSLLLGEAELTGLICSGPKRGTQATHALLEQRVPDKPPLSREEALRALGRRYVQSRGPANERDLAWWSGLPRGDVRQALAAAAEVMPSHLKPSRAPGVAYVHLLPAFDEFLVGYADRGAQLDPAWSRQVNAGGGMLKPVVVVGGRVAGRWRRTLKPSLVQVEVEPFRNWSRTEASEVKRAAARYATFLGGRALELKVGPVIELPAT